MSMYERDGKWYARCAVCGEEWNVSALRDKNWTYYCIRCAAKRRKEEEA